jgi:hypothetical protein
MTRSALRAVSTAFSPLAGRTYQKPNTCKKVVLRSSITQEMNCRSRHFLQIGTTTIIQLNQDIEENKCQIDYMERYFNWLRASLMVSIIGVA